MREATAPRVGSGSAPQPSTSRSLSGIETIVRLLVLRHELDLERGLQVATLISGYPGSPLGGLDLMLEQHSELLDEHKIVHQPGVNEELALAAAWGSQMGASVEYVGVDGVVAGWYGKTPGLDRAGDVLRHANALGSGPNGGFVVFCGDDPSAKSSTLPCDSQYAFQDMCIPVFYPGDQQEILELGVHAYALSRWAGPLVGFKVVTAVADGTGTVELDLARYRMTRELSPPIIDGKPWRHEPLWTIGPHRIPEQERLMVDTRLAAAKAYVRQLGLDRVSGAGPGARLGIVCAGKTYYDLMQAFRDLGVSRDALASVGVRVLKLAMTFPLVEATVVELARSVEQLVVIEEKRPFIETQLRAAVQEAGCSTRVLGKRTSDGRTLISSVGELDAGQIADALTILLPELKTRRTPRTAKPRSLVELQLPARSPAYCSGCPHNRSTVAPEDALVGGGIGCHGMVYFEPRQSELQKLPPPPMGAEGVPWIGLAPFVASQHLIQNIGDGTLSHSGTLAIRASVAAGVNVTYKILYNGVVAMTGGQDVAGLMEVPALTRALAAEGVTQIVVCADEPSRYASEAHFAAGVEVLDRSLLSGAQQRLRTVKGVSVIIYDQRCAAEARSLRKKGALPTPPARVVINEAVCEGCGDCVRKSNCMSVMPHRTEFGDKRRVDDLSCNRDYTCLDGECPSFVTLVPKGAQKKRVVRAAVALPNRQGGLPIPPRAEVEGSFSVFFTGIGGTGVVTASRILSAAAEEAGLVVSVMDQTGLSQKAGAVVSHLHFAAAREALGAVSVGAMGADLYLSGDILQAAGPAQLAKVRPGKTLAVIERELAPTATMQQAGQRPPELDLLRQVIEEQLGQGRARFVASTRIADKVFAESVLANIVLLGAAFQLGGLPFSLAHIEAALARNSRGSGANREAFEWGRWAVHDPEAVTEALASLGDEHPTMHAFEPTARANHEASALLAMQPVPEDLAAHLQRRVGQVIDYQNAALARRYLKLVLLAALCDAAERGWQLTRAVAESWFKLLTYKDEYEVARLHAAANYDAVAKRLGIEGRYALVYHLHPPILQRFGLRKKLPFGKLYAWLFAVLRRMKWLRGTMLDIFRWDPDRKLERELIEEYETLTGSLLADEALAYATKVDMAASALDIRGYREVKARNVELWRKRVAALR